MLGKKPSVLNSYFQLIKKYMWTRPKKGKGEGRGRGIFF
jgi:hypothetical protein